MTSVEEGKSSIEISTNDDTIHRNVFNSNEFISSFNHDDNKKQENFNNLLTLSSLMLHYRSSDDYVSSESRLIHSKLQRLFHFLLTDMYSEPMTQASANQISNLTQVDEALITLNRNATLKFRNYKQLREQLLASLNERQNSSRSLEHSQNRLSNIRSSLVSNFNLHRILWLRSKHPFRKMLHLILRSSFYKWFIAVVICLDAVSVAITSEYSLTDDTASIVYIIAMYINRCILFIYIFETILKWIDNFVNFWYSPSNILEFSLTITSLVNLIIEIYIDSKDTMELRLRRKNKIDIHKNYDTLERIRSYKTILSVLRTLRMLRILRILEIAFRFTHVRIVFLALSRSVKLIFHVVLLTIVLNYFFALIALYLTQFGLNTESNVHRENINSLFGTVPRAFITVFRLFTKDEWYEIKSEMHSLNISPFIIDVYVLTWLFFGGYILNPLLVGAMVGTFDETRKELSDNIKRILSKTRLSYNETNQSKSQSSESSFSSFIDHIDSNDNNKFDEWIRLTLNEIRLIIQDNIDTQWPIYTTFYYLQLLEMYYENIIERQLLFEFFSIYLLTLHDKEIKSINPPILSSSSSSSTSDDDDINN